MTETSAGEPGRRDAVAVDEPAPAGWDVAVAPDADVTDDDAAAATAPASRWRFVAWLALTLASVGVAVWLGLSLSSLFAHKALMTARDEAMAAARQAAVNFTSFDAKTVERQLALVDQESTGDFKAQWDDSKATIRARANQQKVTSKSYVRGAAIASASTTEAQVLIALDDALSAGKQSNCVGYELQLHMVKQRSVWLVEDANFLGTNTDASCA